MDSSDHGTFVVSAMVHPDTGDGMVVINLKGHIAFALQVADARSLARMIRRASDKMEAALAERRGEQRTVPSA